MPVKNRPAKRTPTRKTASKEPQVAKQTGAFQLPPAEILRKTIAYFYALAYIAPGYLSEFVAWTGPKRRELAAAAGMDPIQYFRGVTPEVCRRIVAFHQGTRSPDPKLVDALTQAALTLDQSPECLQDYQQEMARIAALPGRAKQDNRLHRRHGCEFCLEACSYGFFTLVSDPSIKTLEALLKEEAARPVDRQTPLRPAYSFAMTHLSSVTGSTRGSLTPERLTNLAYCLLLLGMARSRRSTPERELAIFQQSGQFFARDLRNRTAPAKEASPAR